MSDSGSRKPAQVTVGQQMDPLIVESVDHRPMKTMAAIIRDPNPIHFDVDAVRLLGLGERVVNQGPINMSFLANAVVRWAGDARRLRRFSVRFLGNVFAGDRVECTGVVVSVDPEAGTLELELQATVDGDPVLVGSATVALPDDA